MRAIFLLTLLCFLLPFLAVAKKDIPLKYDIICAGSGNAGTSLVKVSVYVDKANITTDIIKKAAVHGLILKVIMIAGGEESDLWLRVLRWNRNMLIFFLFFSKIMEPI